MKYFVQANRCYLVSVTADSALAAEHVCLDLDGVCYANAFDMDTVNTDTFRGALLDCTTISVDELKGMSIGYADLWKKYSQRKADADAAAAEERRLHDLLEEAITARKEAAAAALEAQKAARSWQFDVMGLRPDDVR